MPEREDTPRQEEEQNPEHWVWVSQARNLLENYLHTLAEQREKAPMPTGTTMRRYTNEIRELCDRLDQLVAKVAPPEQSQDTPRQE